MIGFSSPVLAETRSGVSRIDAQLPSIAVEPITLLQSLSVNLQ
jgi:hypothetical protein